MHMAKGPGGIKRAIVIKNQYSIKGADGKGSRGSTPGAYVERYMGRADAVECCLPDRAGGVYTYLTRYAARRDAVMSVSAVEDTGDAASSSGARDGVAFGADTSSLTHEAFLGISRRIQDAFDAGEPVLKCVLSFDTDYLRRTGVLDSDCVIRRRGDARGHVDQMRLRDAIREGMRSLAHSFDDMLWCGVLQFDTMHVHAHLAIVECDHAGMRRMRPDGEHAGRLSSREMARIRRGIDAELDRTYDFPHMTASISDQRRNVRGYVSAYVREAVLSAGNIQVLMATLPADRRLWHASSRRREMQRANELAYALVEDALAVPESGYAEVERMISAYASARCAQEGAGAPRRRELVRRGRERVKRECVNEVYRELSRVRERPVSTRAIDVMCDDISRACDMVDATDGERMLFRLRTYSARLDSAKKTRRDMHDAVRAFDEAASKQAPVSAAIKVRDYYSLEEDYQTMLMCKYQAMLPIQLPDEELERELLRLQQDAERISRMVALTRDERLYACTDGEAESLGRAEYGIRQGSLAAAYPDEYARLIDNARDELAESLSSARFRAAESGYGLSLQDDGDSLKIVRTDAHIYTFDEVKAADIHHLRYDFGRDVDVGARARSQFCALARDRGRAFDEAAAYLRATQQAYVLDALPAHDVEAMRICADELERTGRLASLSGRGADDHIQVARISQPFAAQVRGDICAFAREHAAQIVNELP